MQRIATGDGRFAAGNPALGTPGTMVTSLYMNNLQDEICNAIEGAGLALDPENTHQLLEAMRAIVSASSLLVVPTTPAEQLSSGLIFVSDRLNFQTWVETAYYTGYRSLECGTARHGATITPAPYEIEAEGDIIGGDDEPSLIAYFKENGLTVPIANWTAGTHFLGVMGDGTYRLPDLRNMFQSFRAGATDPDTANARTLGSKQSDALQRITGAHAAVAAWTPSSNASGAITATPNTLVPLQSGASGSCVQTLLDFDSARVARTSTENRSLNTAYYPRLHV